MPYVVDPLARVELTPTESGVQLELVDRAGRSRLRLGSGVARAYFALAQHCSEHGYADTDSLGAVLAREGVPVPEAQAIVALMIDRGILRQQLEAQDQVWLRRGWRAARLFDLASRADATSFVDAGPPEIVGRKKAELLDGYLRSSDPPPFFSHNGKAAQALPAPRRFDHKTESVLLSRRTTRSFRADSLPLDALATLLQQACQPVVDLRNYAAENVVTATNLLTLSSYTPFELYVAVQDVEPLSDGLYHYWMDDHKLAQIKAGRFSQRIHQLAVGQVLEECPVIFLVTASVYRYMWRYRYPRALRHVYIEAASLAQRLVTAAGGLGLGSFVTPAIRDALTERLLDSDPWEYWPLYVCGVGYSVR